MPWVRNCVGGDMWKTLGELISSFCGAIPEGWPVENATPLQIEAFARKRRRFDQMVALGGLAVAGALIFHIAWAGGYLQYEDANGDVQGLSGFATTTQVEPIGGDVKALLKLHERESINNARTKIRDNRRRQCLAAMNGLPTDIYNAPIEEGLEDYRIATNGEEFEVPSCDQFVVTTN